MVSARRRRQLAANMFTENHLNHIETENKTVILKRSGFYLNLSLHTGSILK